MIEKKGEHAAMTKTNEKPSESLCTVFEFPGCVYPSQITKTHRERPKALTERHSSIKLSDEKFMDDANVKPTHAADPIKEVSDIWRVQEFLISKKRYRDNLLFTCGVNFGLRIGDLLKLKVGHLLDSNGAYKAKIELTEEKTQKRRVVFLNDAVMDAADLYFDDLQEKEETCNLNDYLFKSQSNNGKNVNKPIDIRNVERMLKDVINNKCGLDVHASTHCLRKTFAYHVIMSANDRARAVEFLQKIFGHSSSSITLMYAGITDDEIQAAYQNLNLGIRKENTRGFDWNQSSGYAVRGAC